MNGFRPTRRTGHWSAALLTVVLVLLAGGPASSQSDDPGSSSLGSPDHRTAPVLSPGTYSDTIKTGQVNWYAVLYTNNTPYAFSADLPGIDLDASDELTLEIAFVGPTLGSIDRGRSIDGGASYGGGGTNRWYLAVKLDTTGRLGEVHELELDVEGVVASGLEDCDTDPACTLDLDLAEIETEITDLQAAIDELPNEDPTAVLRDEIDGLERRQNEAETALNEATGEIATICAPAATCDQVTDPGSETPAWAWGAGALVFLAGLGLAGVALVKS